MIVIIGSFFGVEKCVEEGYRGTGYRWKTMLEEPEDKERGYCLAKVRVLARFINR